MNARSASPASTKSPSKAPGVADAELDGVLALAAGTEKTPAPGDRFNSKPQMRNQNYLGMTSRAK